MTQVLAIFRVARRREAWAALLPGSVLRGWRGLCLGVRTPLAVFSERAAVHYFEFGLFFFHRFGLRFRHGRKFVRLPVGVPIATIECTSGRRSRQVERGAL